MFSIVPSKQDAQLRSGQTLHDERPAETAADDTAVNVPIELVAPIVPQPGIGPQLASLLRYLARTEVHTSDPERVAPVIADGLKIVAGVDSAGDRGTAELRYRRRGLAVSLGAILLVVVALALKIRRLYRGLS